MPRLVGGGIAVALLATTLAAARAEVAPAPATEADLPRETTRGVVVDLADGDRFAVSVSRNLREVRGRRYDAATGTWGERTVVLRRKNLFCGDVDARAAGTSVALIAECDRFGYAEDQAPTHSQALWSDDLVTWRVHRLEGEAYEEPGISPDGRSAVWPQYQGHLTLTPAEGFGSRTISLPGQEYTETATIADDGRVSVLYGRNGRREADCRFTVVTRLGDGEPVRQELDVPNACSDSSLVNVDALTVLFGDRTSPAYVTTISRPDQSSAWTVTAVAPSAAPGLVERGGRAGTTYVSSPGLPLVALSSADRSAVDVQEYDALAQRWGPLRPLTTLPGPCHWEGAFSSQPFGVLVAQVACAGRSKALVSTDGSTWTTVQVASHPLGVSADRRWVSSSTRRSTTVFSRELGRVVLPVGATRRCDVVLPSGPGSALRLTTSRASGWPTVLQESTASGWRRTDTAVPRARARNDTCRRVQVDLYGTAPSYTFSGRLHSTTLSVVPRGDGWKVRRTLY
ncbi:hypothetical protein ASG94_19200 [Nocardioides sp. Soil805]|nr:hypothetical protein ASG94_19200 [Nocardioides sp. Soil805]